MSNVPNANRKHIAFFGKTNAGKSALVNAIIGQEISLVSSIKGTTTDPVIKAMELIPYGPVVLIDTAGLDDKGTLGDLRVKRSLKMLERTDLAVYIIDINDIDERTYSDTIKYFKKYNIPYLTVINKIDTVYEEKVSKIKTKYEKAVFVSVNNKESINTLKDKLINILNDNEDETPIVGDLVPYDGKVILVIPIDSEAPKGRLILPQVQVIRDCLDNGIKSYVVRDTELKSAINDMKDVDLVITDSQAFKRVSEIVPGNIKLTSFSILFARHKGDLDALLQGIEKVKELDAKSKILIAENCSHNTSHEDIGRHKIPNLLNKHTGLDLNYDFYMGHDYPDNLEEYDLVIHCGACMLNKKAMENRIAICKEKNVDITNYGIILAYLTGILKRSIEIFN